MPDLAHKKCIPCEGGVDPMPPEEVQQYLEVVKDWQLEDGKIARELVFADFKEALAFINRVGEVAEAEGHHPDINLFNWNHVKFTLSTHAIKGLHLNDFILATKINELAKGD